MISSPPDALISGRPAIGGRNSAGFTLIEMMVVVAIVAIFATVAVPGFQQLILTSKLKSYANELMTSVVLARSEAIKRNAPIKLCVSTDGTTCAGSGDWEAGWIVFFDADNDNVLDVADGDAVIKRTQEIDSRYKLTGSGGATMTFQPSGASSTASTLKICRLSPEPGNQERVVTVSATGRPRISTTDTGICP